MVTAGPQLREAPLSPQNLDAEEMVVGALLLADSVGPEKTALMLEAVRETGLEPGSFYREGNGRIYRACTSLIARGEPCDGITVVAELERLGQLSDSSSAERVQEIASLVVPTGNIGYYARLVVEQERRRDLIKVGAEISRLGYEGSGDIPELLKKAIGAAERLREPEPVDVRPRLVFVRGDEFVQQPIMRAEPLVGEGKDALLMPGSLAILAGVGGAGKTTLSMHAIAHWASGLPWFGIPTPRPIRIIVIENEGPHDPYVEKVKEFSQRFRGCPCGDLGAHGDGGGFLERCFFLDAPWGHFSFDDPGCARELQAYVRDTQADLVVANPLGRLGMRGAGTPEDTRAFLQLLFNAGLNDDFAALLLHHFSKIGRHVPIVQQLSGDWGPHPDLILALEPDGERKSKMTFGKVRWGDQGRAPMLLEWLTDPDGPVGYNGQSAPVALDDEVIYSRLDEFLHAQPEPVGATDVRKHVKGNNKRLGELLQRGVETGRYLSTGGSRPRFALAPDLGGEPDIDYQPTFEEATP